jgi:N utilization substance protein A
MVELTGEDLTFFSKFESITGVMPVDFKSSGDLLIFLVEPNKLGKAIGKKGSNIEKLGKVFRKKVMITADSPDIENFISSFFNNINIQAVDVKDIMGSKAVVLFIDENDRGIAIGKGGDRIKAAKSLLKEKFDATLHLKTRRTAI